MRNHMRKYLTIVYYYEVSCTSFSELQNSFAKRSSDREWKDQGDAFFRQKKWIDAANCYSNAGNGWFSSINKLE